MGRQYEETKGQLMAQTGFNIANFSAVLSEKGVQKTNKFLVRFSIPFGAASISSTLNTARTLEFWCDSVTLPGFMIQAFPVLRYGYGTVEKKPNQPTFNDVSLSVIGDGKGDNWGFFASWLNFILSFDASNAYNSTGTETVTRGDIPNASMQLAELSYKYEYASDISILTFNDSGSVIHNLVLREAFPIMLGDTQLNWADNNNITRFNVVLTYNDWYLTKTV